MREHLSNPAIFSQSATAADNTMLKTTACAFNAMHDAAKRSGVTITINSAFRCLARQEYFCTTHTHHRHHHAHRQSQSESARLCSALAVSSHTHFLCVCPCVRACVQGTATSPRSATTATLPPSLARATTAWAWRSTSTRAARASTTGSRTTDTPTDSSAPSPPRPGTGSTDPARPLRPTRKVGETGSLLDDNKMQPVPRPLAAQTDLHSLAGQRSLRTFRHLSSISLSPHPFISPSPSSPRKRVLVSLCAAMRAPTPPGPPSAAAALRLRLVPLPLHLSPPLLVHLAPTWNCHDTTLSHLCPLSEPQPLEPPRLPAAGSPLAVCAAKFGRLAPFLLDRRCCTRPQCTLTDELRSAGVEGEQGAWRKCATVDRH